MEKLADSIASAFGEGVGGVLDSGADPLLVADAALAENTPAGLVGMLTHVLRHELAGALRRERANRLMHSDLPPGATTEMAVGFVDLVGITETMEFLDSGAIWLAKMAYYPPAPEWPGAPSFVHEVTYTARR